MAIENRREIFTIIVGMLITSALAREILINVKSSSTLLWLFFLALFPLLALISYYELFQEGFEEIKTWINY